LRIIHAQNQFEDVIEEEGIDVPLSTEDDEDEPDADPRTGANTGG